MERSKPYNQPDYILCGDLHLREDTPICFIGDYQKEQWLGMEMICNLQLKYNIPILNSGDLFHHWKPSPYLLSKTIEYLPRQFFSIMGNHDLPQHNLDFKDKCGINVLQKAGKLTILHGTHFGQEPTEPSIIFKVKNRKILVWHKLAYQTIPFPGATGGNAKELLKKYSQFDLILCGDNHQTFVEECQGRILVNSGSMMRMTAAQADHKPCVFLWYAETNTVTPVYLPIEEGVVSREHLQIKEERNERIDSFIAKLSGDYKIEVSFEENLKMFFETNDIEKDVEQITYQMIEK
jgi:DNA repair exonuclease SbcCD nuclease subunit